MAQVTVLGQIVTVCCYIPGTLAANHTLEFKFPFDVSLLAVSLSGSNSNSCVVDIGNTSDADIYADGIDCGDSEVATIHNDDGDFVDSVYPHIVADTNIILTVDYDGAGGTAVDDFCAVLFFSKG